MIAQAGLSFVTEPQMNWSGNWAWGVPLIVTTVIIHVLGLGVIGRGAGRVTRGRLEHRHPITTFVIVVGGTTLLATSLHALEAAIWGLAYLIVGALPDSRTAMLSGINMVVSLHCVCLTYILPPTSPRGHKSYSLGVGPDPHAQPRATKGTQPWGRTRDANFNSVG